MPTIADYLDDAPKRKIDNFQVDLYYLHVPRAIVKRAADEGMATNSGNDAVWSTLKQIGQAAVEATQAAGNAVAPYTMLPLDPNNSINNPIAYHTKVLAGGDTDNAVVNDIANQSTLDDWGATALAWTDYGTRIPEVVANRTFQGNEGLKNIADHVAKLDWSDKEQQDSALRTSTMVNDYTGVAGNTLISPGTFGNQGMNYLRKQIDPKKIEQAKQRILQQYGGEEGVQKLVNSYNDTFFKTEVEPNDYKNTFYGWLDKYPGLRGALRYATPWLAYGVPLSAIGSIMGTNALWGPTILGAVGAGAYGYGVGSGYLRDFAQNNSFGQLLDTIHSTANKPIGALWNYLEPGTGRVGNRFLVEPDTYPEADRPKQDEKSTGSNTTAYNPLYGPRNIYTQGSKPFTHAPSLMQLPDYSTPEQSNLEMNA